MLGTTTSLMLFLYTTFTIPGKEYSYLNMDHVYTVGLIREIAFNYRIGMFQHPLSGRLVLNSPSRGVEKN